MLNFMKKLFLIIFALFSINTIYAQSDVTGNKLRDNWSVGLNVGVATPLMNEPFFGSMRPVMGINVDKQFSPIYGITLEGMTSINTNESYTAFDIYNLSLLHRINLNNLFVQYKGKPSLFEVEAVGGIGWLHMTNSYWKSGDFNDRNHVSSKAGLNLNFNLGKEKSWVLAIKPSVIWDLSKDGSASLKYNGTQAAFELTAGVIYKFKNSTGKHYYSIECDRSEIETLNKMISDMRKDAAIKDNELDKANTKIRHLRNNLNDCQKRNKEKVNEIKVDNKYYISFRQGKSVVDAVQMPNIENLANALKENTNVKVKILGYASPEGNAEFNQKLSENRANAVKKILVEMFGIDENRIVTEGKGIGDFFSNPDWNRVSICIID